MNKEQKFTKKGKFGDYNVEVLECLSEKGYKQYEVVVSFEDSMKSEIVWPQYLNNCIDMCIDWVDNIIIEKSNLINK